MYRLKITSKGWENYNGYLGPIEFVDGISTIPVPRIISDRIAAAVSTVTVDDDGKELEVAGTAYRLIGGATLGATPSELGLATEDDLLAEAARIAAEAPPPPSDVKVYTLEQLEELAGLHGINALREIAKPWRVRDRSIPGLIAEILKAQEAHVAKTSDEGEERELVFGLSALTANLGSVVAGEVIRVEEHVSADAEGEQDVDAEGEQDADDTDEAN